jgi:arylsulfatase A-like enzyme
VWDYDRRVPIIFWRNGYAAQNVAVPAQTVDILPSMAAMIGLALPGAGIDGQCLPQAPGAACPPR